jgi:hypothetical protein
MTRRALVLLVVIAAGLAAVFWLLTRSGRPPAPLPAPTAVREHPVAATPAPRIAPLTPTAEAVVTRRTTVVLPWDAEPTPSPIPPEPTEPPTATPEPTAPAAVEQCVAIRWSAGTSPATITQVLVEIDATNRCGRDLEPLEVWFEIAGYRQGDLVQSVRGHLFDPLPKDGEGKAMIALPGSADWYDEIRVAVLPAGVH